MVTEAKPFVSVVMPALNEALYIAQAINSIIPRSADLPYELLVMDGGSTDGTLEIVEAMAAANPRIRLLANRKRIQAAGINMAAREADPRSRYLVRADCHLRYPEDFVERCVSSLMSRGVASIVVPMHTVGSTCMQRAIAEAQNSRMGNGGSAHRVAGQSGFVDHGHHAAFERATFLDLGGYDEGFSHNEDAEFDKRLVQSGKRIYLDSDATVTYYPRASLRSLSNQYFRHGAGRASTIMKHWSLPRMRQILPIAVLLGCLASLILALWEPWFLAFPIGYAAACALWGIALAFRRGDPCLALSGCAAIVMHMSWATGALTRALKSFQRPRLSEPSLIDPPPPTSSRRKEGTLS